MAGRGTWRLAKGVARERAEDRGLRGQRAARFIDKTWRDIAQGLDMGYRGRLSKSGDEYRLTKARNKAIKRYQKELRRRRNN